MLSDILKDFVDSFEDCLKRSKIVAFSQRLKN